MSRQILIDPGHESRIRTNMENGKDPNGIGEWKVGRTLGAGANGRVRIARHMKSGEYAAIKIMSKRELDAPDADPELARRMKICIMREMVFMKLLHHPNILRMYDAFITRGNYYLILEYVDGHELFHILGDRDEVLPFSKALDYFQQIIVALAHCHHFNIAHRDLKPENILLCNNGVIKLADFGLAGWLADGDGLLLTQCGSPHYMAPEVVIAMGRDLYDGRAADIWSAGMILYTLLTNITMFHAEDHDDLFRQIVGAPIKIPEDLHPDAQDLIACMVDRDVDERYGVDEVMVHPFFELGSPPDLPQGPTFEELAQPIEECDIDSKIVANIRHLSPEASTDLIHANLVCADKTWEQATYQLLLQHRARKQEDLAVHVKRAEEYQAQKKAERVQRKAAERRSRAALERPVTPLNVSDIPPRADPPTPRRASGSRSAEFTDGERTPMLLTPYTESVSPSPISPSFPRTPYSPRWEELALPGIPDVDKLRELCRDPRWSEFFEAVEEHVAGAKPPQPPSVPPKTTAARRVSDRVKAPFTRPLTIRRAEKHKPPPLALQQGRGLGFDDVQIHTGVTEASKENEPITQGGTVSKRKSTLKKAGVENRRPHTADPRKVRIDDEPTWHPLGPSERGNLARRKSETILSRRKSTSAASSDSPRSPVSPAWFAGLFNKTITSEFLSAHDEKATRAECERMLAYMGVYVELTRHDALGMLKCRVDEHQDETGALIKAIRFRVKVQPATQVQAVGGFNSYALFEMDKGAPATFRAFCAKFRQVWDLDVPRLPVQELSPALDTSFQLVDEYVDEIQY